MSARPLKKIVGFAVIATLWSVVAALLISYRWTEELELRTWDWRLRAVAEPSQADKRIAIIMLDQSSLEHFAEHEKIFWPWPRAMYEAVIGYLAEAGARGVAFDVLFTEQSSYGVDDDAALGAATAGSLPVVSAVALRKSNFDKISPQVEAFRERQTTIMSLPEMQSALRSFPPSISSPSVTVPIEDLLRASKGFGNVSAEPDNDGVFRRALAVGAVHNTPIFTLPIALYMATLRSGEPIPDIRRFADRDGLLPVRFHGAARTYRTFPIDAVIRSFQRIQSGEPPIIPLEELKDTWVFIGMDAPGLLDLRPIPLAKTYPGVEFHATVLDNLLHNQFVKRFDTKTNGAMTAALITLCAAIGIFLSQPRLQYLLFTFMFVGFCSLCFWLAEHNIWLDLFTPAAAMLAAIASALGYKYQLEGSQARFIKNAFRQYVSGDVIERILIDPSAMSLGGERRELTIYFSDIAGFTSISESLEANKLVKLLNTFLSEMSSQILRESGTLDKYVGDAIVAFWNAPLQVDDHPVRAVRASLACIRKQRELAPLFRKEFGVEVRMRIGLHTGPVNVGNFGSNDRFNYTVLGDSANLASRLEGANKYFGTSILFSEQTRKTLPADLLCRKVGEIRVVGKKEVICVYEPLDEAIHGSIIDALTSYHAALELFMKGELQSALVAFEALSFDYVSDRYVERIKKALESPETEPWSGVWNLSEK